MSGLSLWLLQGAGVSSSGMTLLPQFYLDSLVVLEVGPDRDGNYRAVATGFVAGFKIGRQNQEGRELYGTFLVTNKHVVENGDDLTAKFNRGEASARVALPAKRESGDDFWTLHSRYDIAVARVNLDFLRQEGAEPTFVPDEQMLTSEEMQDKGVATGDDVFVLGFPLGMAGSRRNYGIARAGIIARFDEEILEDDRSFLIDSSVFPGNSGGPVVLRPSMTSIKGTPIVSEAFMIGVIASYVPYTDVAVSEQTHQPRIIFQENSGLAMVVPFEAVRELVDPILAPERAANADVTDNVDVATKASTGQPEEEVESVSNSEDSTAP